MAQRQLDTLPGRQVDELRHEQHELLKGSLAQGEATDRSADINRMTADTALAHLFPRERQKERERTLDKVLPPCPRRQPIRPIIAKSLAASHVKNGRQWL